MATLFAAVGLRLLVPDWKVRIRQHIVRWRCRWRRWVPVEHCELRARLYQPSARRYKLQTYKWGSSAAQEHQDLWVDRALNRTRGLFAVESGAFDGEYYSNTLFLETQRNWSCLLVEANPYLADLLLAKRRKCHILLGGLSITRGVGSFRFRPRQLFGGFEETLAEHDEEEWQGKWNPLRNGCWGQRWVVGLLTWLCFPFALDLPLNVTAFPLAVVLHAIGRSVVDYWSLDTEGSELRILQNTDFSRFDFGIISVETRSDGRKLAGVSEVLGRHGIIHVGSTSTDSFFASRKYFLQRGLPFPEHGEST